MQVDPVFEPPVVIAVVSISAKARKNYAVLAAATAHPVDRLRVRLSQKTTKSCLYLERRRAPGWHVCLSSRTLLKRSHGSLDVGAVDKATEVSHPLRLRFIRDVAKRKGHDLTITGSEDIAIDCSIRVIVRNEGKRCSAVDRRSEYDAAMIVIPFGRIGGINTRRCDEKIKFGVGGCRHAAPDKVLCFSDRGPHRVDERFAVGIGRSTVLASVPEINANRGGARRGNASQDPKQDRRTNRYRPRSVRAALVGKCHCLSPFDRPLSDDLA